MDPVQDRQYSDLHLRAFLDSRKLCGYLIKQVFGTAKTHMNCRSSEEFELVDKGKRGI